MPRIRALLLVPLAFFALFGCEGEPLNSGLAPTPDNVEYTEESFPPNVCLIRAHWPHVSGHQRAKGIIQIVAQVSYECMPPLPHSHTLTLFLERRSDDGSWRVMTQMTCCINVAVIGGKAPQVTLPLVTPDGRTCIPGTWRFRVEINSVSATGIEDRRAEQSPPVEIAKCS
jgi:hypothetical protein